MGGGVGWVWGFSNEGLVLVGLIGNKLVIIVSFVYSGN